MEIEDILSQVDIVEFISQFVELEQKGNEFWGLSCFKDEKTPSFSVREDPPVFYDFSSGIGGNVYTFTKKYFRCSDSEAKQILIDYLGGESKVRSNHLDLYGIIRKFRPKARKNKQGNGVVLPDNYMLRYPTGEKYLKPWLDEGISPDVLWDFQVCYDDFSNRIVYPIRNIEGKIVNIGGRTLDPEWKEKGLRKYCYFYNWGSMDVIYGLYENLRAVIQKKEIILFEGCKSVLLASTWGINNCGALLTSHLNDRQAKLLLKLACDHGCRAVFALDKDVDIRLDRGINRLKKYMTVEFVRDLDDLLDPKDSPVDKGQRVFEKLYADRIAYGR